MDAVTASNSNSNNHHGSTKKFFVHTLEHLTTSNIITPYTRDKLIDMINSDAKRDFAKVRNPVLVLFATVAIIPGDPVACTDTTKLPPNGCTGVQLMS